MTGEKTKGKMLTTEMLNHWQTTILEQKAIGSLRKLLLAFQTGCHISDAATEKKPKDVFNIGSSAVFNELMQVKSSSCPSPGLNLNLDPDI